MRLEQADRLLTDAVQLLCDEFGWDRLPVGTWREQQESRPDRSDEQPPSRVQSATDADLEKDFGAGAIIGLPVRPTEPPSFIEEGED